MTQTAHRTVLGFVVVMVVVGSAAAWFALGPANVGGQDITSARSIGDSTTALGGSGHVVGGASEVLNVTLAAAVEDLIDSGRSNYAPVHISARVVDEDGAPLAGATFVLASGASTSNGFDTFEHTSDHKGRIAFDITGARAARMARATTPEVITVTVDGYQSVSERVECGAISHLALGDITLAPGLYITGRVVDPYDRAIAGATVTTRRSSRYRSSSSFHLARPDAHKERLAPITTTADAHGRFAIEASARRSYGQPDQAYLEVTADGFAPRFSAFAIDEPSGTVAIGNIVVDAGWTLRGLVRSPSHGAAADALVIASRTQPDETHYARMDHAEPAPGGTSIDDHVWWTVTDEHGHFQFDGLADTTFTLYVVAKHGVHRRTMITSTSESLEVLLDEFQPQTYQFLDEWTGEPVAPDRVTAFFGVSPNEPFAEANTRFRFPATPVADDPTRWMIPKPKWFAPTIFVDLEDYRARPRQSRASLILARHAQLEFNITSDEGISIENATVILKRVDESDRAHEIGRAYSDVDGVASFREASAGKRQITIEAPGYASVRKTVELAAGVTTLLEQMVPASRLIVHVRDADGEPVPAACLEPAYSPDIRRWVEGTTMNDTLSTRDDGAYEFLQLTMSRPYWSGPGTFVFNDLHPGRYHVEYEPGGIANIEVPEHTTVSVDLTLRRWPIVSGVVLNNGLPVEGANVTSETAMGRGMNLLVSFGDKTPELTPPSATTDAAGRWSMPIPPGERYVMVNLDHAAKTESLHTLEFNERYNVVHDISSRALSGVVTTPSGDPVADASVYAKPNGGFATTDADGRFELPFAGTDVKTLFAAHLDYLRAMRPEEMSLVSPIRLELVPGAQLTFHFESDTGESLSPQRLKKHMVRLRDLDAPGNAYVRTNSAVKGGCTHVARGVPRGRYRLSVVKKISRGVTETLVTEDIDVTDATPIERTVVVPVIH